MTTRDNTSSILLVILLIVTFPIWFAIGAALFGVVAGIFGALIGIVAAVFGACVAIIALPFKLIFGWGSWHLGHWGFPFWDGHTFFWVAAIIFVILLLKNRK